MKHEFKARIYKVGINPCVKVPKRITNKLENRKGYIPVKGLIEKSRFQQTLVPVKNSSYRLYVNGPMLKATGLKIGQTAHFTIEQDTWKRNENHPTPKLLIQELQKQGLQEKFEALSASRQKEINRYLNNLKTEESLKRNVDRMIDVLQGKGSSPLLPAK